MEKDLIDGKLGDVGQYDLEFKGGKLRFELKAGKLGVNAGLLVEVEADAVIDAVAKAIPGQIDDAVLGLLKGALKA